MKIKILILTAFSLLLLWSCTPEVDEDMLSIYSENNSVYEVYQSLDTNAVLVKTRYSSFPYRNGVSLGDTSYSANTLFIFEENGGDTLYLQNLNNDSNLYAAKWDNISNEIFIRYTEGSDTLIYIRNVNDASIGDTISFNYSAYPDTAIFVEANTSEMNKIDELNGSNRYYKTYQSWKDDMINLYR
ncbi:MAG: hypothetical protein GQ534_07225 [Candidatus Delongbacteria bacterium]|nr:hypothetical protein [Candidatus Delongbacteria bacterium]